MLGAVKRQFWLSRERALALAGADPHHERLVGTDDLRTMCAQHAIGAVHADLRRRRAGRRHEVALPANGLAQALAVPAAPTSGNRRPDRLPRDGDRSVDMQNLWNSTPWLGVRPG